jgi:hypothetical protein
MTSEIERRRHRRYRVRLEVKLRRGEVEVAAEVFNLSVGGCLLVTPVQMAVGETALLEIPKLGLTDVRLRVLRCRQMSFWCLAACQFEQLLADEAPLARLASEEGESDPEPDQVL